MNTHYSVEQWAAGTMRGRQVFNYNYRMMGIEVRGWELLKVVTLQEGRDVTQRAYMWQRKRDPEHEVLRIDIVECHNWQQAQASLHAYLIQCMRPDIPLGTNKLAKLGDIVFVSREPQSDIPGVVSFTRGNMFVSVSSNGENNIDVSGIAGRLDRALSQPPSRSELERGKIRKITLKAVTVKANETYILIKNLRNATRRGEWLKIIVPDGELSRKGNVLIYVSAQGGKKQVDAFAVSFD